MKELRRMRRRSEERNWEICVIVNALTALRLFKVATKHKMIMKDANKRMYNAFNKFIYVLSFISCLAHVLC